MRELDAVIYVPSGYGKQIKPGMPILVAPTTVKQEEFGQMLARVTYVSDFPATPRGMQRTLKNEQLVQSLARGDAPYEVHAELLLDPDTRSGFKWSSSKGPPSRIQSGTMATANIEVDQRRPIELVVPLIREWSGNMSKRRQAGRARPPSCRWRRWSAGRRRWPSCWPTTAASSRWRSCASPAACPATAARPATWCGRRGRYGLEAEGFKQGAGRRCASCRCR